MSNKESYHDVRKQLDSVIEKLQHPDCDVDEAAGMYEEALKLIAKLEASLQQTENRIKKVQADFKL